MRENVQVQDELKAFQGIWHSGFYAGDPRNPTFGLWGITSFMGVSHAVYLACCKPNVMPSTTVLEIGCGRGAWTRLMLNAKHVYCLDALSAEHNGFYDYVGRLANVDYFKVEDFSLSEIPSDSIDFVFSYDALCHVSFTGISEYATNLFDRMRQGAHGVWMVADYEKYNRFVCNQQAYCVLNALLPRSKSLFIRPLLKFFVRIVTKWNDRRYRLRALNIEEDNAPRPGRWYHAGTKRTCQMLQEKGFTVMDEDMGLDFRSPLIHFRK